MMEKTDHQGTPSEKAKDSLGEKMNRPDKPPPELPKENAEPPARRLKDEIDDL